MSDKSHRCVRCRKQILVCDGDHLLFVVHDQVVLMHLDCATEILNNYLESFPESEDIHRAVQADQKRLRRAAKRNQDR